MVNLEPCRRRLFSRHNSSPIHMHDICSYQQLIGSGKEPMLHQERFAGPSLLVLTRTLNVHINL